MQGRGKSTYFNQKHVYKGERFDSKGELVFYKRYLENSSYQIKLHPNYRVIDTFALGGYNVRSISYKPDFVVLNHDGSIKHVYDYKTSINSNYIQGPAKLRFKLFEKRYHVPVEIVTNLTHCFKMTVIGLTTSFDVYRMTNIDYDITDYIGM